jgi:hypothetical protein
VGGEAAHDAVSVDIAFFCTQHNSEEADIPKSLMLYKAGCRFVADTSLTL